MRAWLNYTDTQWLGVVLWVLGQCDRIHVTRTDELSFPRERDSHPLEQATPELASDENHRTACDAEETPGILANEADGVQTHGPSLTAFPEQTRFREESGHWSPDVSDQAKFLWEY
jgi:hypothetical protein